MSEAAGEERFEQAAQLRDALRTIETLGQRQQKMAGTGLGDRDAFGLKIGPAGAVVQVFQVRGGKVIERIELATSAEGIAEGALEGKRQKAEGTGDSREQDILQAALEQFYTDHPAPPEIHIPVALNESETEIVEAWLTKRSEHRVRSIVPETRREARPARPRRAQRPGRVPDALQRDRRGALRRARNAPRRAQPPVASRDASSASTSRPSREAKRSPRWWSAKTDG